MVNTAVHFAAAIYITKDVARLEIIPNYIQNYMPYSTMYHKMEIIAKNMSKWEKINWFMQFLRLCAQVKSVHIKLTSD